MRSTEHNMRNRTYLRPTVGISYRRRRDNLSFTDPFGVSVPQKMQLKLPSKANESFNYLEIQCYCLFRSDRAGTNAEKRRLIFPSADCQNTMKVRSYPSDLGPMVVEVPRQ
jgi:hypothetical protein